MRNDLENTDKVKEEQTIEEQRKELREELIDNQFTFGLFSLSKYEKMAETNPKKAYIMILGPFITAAIVLALVYFIFI